MLVLAQLLYMEALLHGLQQAPDRLSFTGLVGPEDTVAVVGSSHSAALVLMNLLTMEGGPCVLQLHRSPWHNAKCVDGGPPTGYIVRDNTGLKVHWMWHHPMSRTGGGGGVVLSRAEVPPLPVSGGFCSRLGTHSAGLTMSTHREP